MVGIGYFDAISDIIVNELRVVGLSWVLVL